MQDYQQKTASAQETFNLGQDFAGKLKGGEVIGLVGELGAGKTVFIQGLAKGLGVKEIVNSPTFVLMKIYKTNDSKIKQLVHLDAYRLTSSQELKDIGLREYLDKKDVVVIIEWADKVKDALPSQTIMINFEIGQNENQRTIKTI